MGAAPDCKRLIHCILRGLSLKKITSAREYGGHLYLGSLHNDRIGRYLLP